MFGCVRIHSDAFGYIRMRSDAFGNFGKFLEVFGKNLYSFDDSERFRRFLEVFGRVRMHSDGFGYIRKFLEASGIFLEFCIFFGKFWNFSDGPPTDLSQSTSVAIYSEKPLFLY